MKIQLVHESVLTVDHYVRNKERGINTVLLVSASRKEDAGLKLKAFIDRVRQRLPASHPEITACCVGDGNIQSPQKLHRNILKRLSTALPKPPKIIEYHPDWQN